MTTHATRGNGKAIHIATTNALGELVTLCDKWATGNAIGGRNKGRVRKVEADHATCKRCLANVMASAPAMIPAPPAETDVMVTCGKCGAVMSAAAFHTTHKCNTETEATVIAYQATIRELHTLNRIKAEADFAADMAKRNLVKAVTRAWNDGGVSEYTLATELGVTRQTVRAWLGK